MTIYNFSAGPAVLPKEVLQQAQAELLDWHGSGMSVMEMTHRGKEFMGIHAQAEADLRELMGIPANYKVLFLQGGAHLQFSMIPLNLLRGKLSADYVNTGEWSKKAIERGEEVQPRECGGGQRRQELHLCARRSIPGSWTRRPPMCTTRRTRPSAAWNSTGCRIPATCRWWRTCPPTSCRVPMMFRKFGLIYAGAQKNIGPAGLTLVIVREDLVGHADRRLPTMLDYKIHADNDSMYNTPPTYGIYMAGLVFQWLKKNGGVAAMEKDQHRQGETAV